MKKETQLLQLTMADLEWATALLTEAFIDKPPLPQLFPEPYRRKQADYFMRSSCAYALLFGEGYATPERDGVSLWLLPGKTTMTTARAYRAGLLMAPFKLGWRGFYRLMAFAGYTEKLHQESVPMPHYYLFVLGVSPPAQGKGVGGLLLRDMLKRIDEEKMPVYLETQNEKNVELYRKFGFEVSAHGPFPKLEGLQNWSMLRKAAG